MKMGEVLIGLLVIALGFGGGYFTGAKVEKKKADQHLTEIVENTDKMVTELNGGNMKSWLCSHFQVSTTV